MTRRIIIGGTDCTDAIKANVAAAPPLSPAQAAMIRMIFADTPIRPGKAHRRPIHEAERAEAA